MKFLPLIFLVFSINVSFSNTFEVQVNFGYCASLQNGQAIVLASGGEAPYTFQWSDPDLEGAEVYDLNPGAYSVTVSDNTACSVIESFEIPENSAVLLDFEIFDITCAGANDGKLFINDFSPSDLLFSTDGINFSDQTIYENLEPGNFNLFVLESNGCITEEIFPINEPFALLVDIGANVEILLGDEVFLQPLVNSNLDNLAFEWASLGSDIISCPNCIEQIVSPVESTTYSITVTDEWGCSTSDQIYIVVLKPDQVFIPNAFSPNGDGINDVFRVFAGVSIEQVNHFIIRDNFGSIVFENHDFQPNISSGWDGTFRGERVNMNIFLYYVQLEYKDGSVKDFFGTVSALR